MTEFDIKREYKGMIAIEQLTAAQINRIMEYGGQKEKMENYEEGIECLIDLLPPDIEEKAIEFKKENGVNYNLTPEGKLRYRALFRHIKRLLAEGNIVWKKSSYEVGTEAPSEPKKKESALSHITPEELDRRLDEIDDKFKF